MSNATNTTPNAASDTAQNASGTNTNSAAFPQPQSAEELQAHIDTMRDFFKSGATLDVNFRLQQLTRLKAWLKLHEALVLDALEKDLGKVPF